MFSESICRQIILYFIIFFINCNIIILNNYKFEEVPFSNTDFYLFICRIEENVFVYQKLKSLHINNQRNNAKWRRISIIT